jgi:pyruvate dehydrogenase E2 component (dihydrolipoamide acetyltransferase)
MGMSEGRPTAWHRSVGDKVEEGEPLVEIEAEKTTADVEAPVSGTLLHILVPAGETVPVRTVLAMIGDPSEVIDVAVPHAPVAPAAQARPETTPRPNRQATPVARRLAKELGVDLDSVEGTGPSGRITEDDVRRRAAAPGPASTPTPAEVASTAAGQAMALTGMRAAIARRMAASLREMAQLTLTRQIDVTDLVSRQQELKTSDGISLNDLLLKAVAVCLVRHPELNATLEGDAITRHAEVRLGMAVALEEGLIVPVIRDAANKGLEAISREAKALAERARSGRASPAEVSGSTFTVTNLGALGIDAFTPIVNPPEVGILGVGRVVEILKREGDGMAWRKAITFSLTIDHRALDGATGARYLGSLADHLGNPSTLL